MHRITHMLLDLKPVSLEPNVRAEAISSEDEGFTPKRGYEKKKHLLKSLIFLNKRMRFRLYDNLRMFTRVARHESLTRAAEELNLTKGSISHQIRNLEYALGFAVLSRSQKGITVTEKGRELLEASNIAFSDLERLIERLRDPEQPSVTLAVSSYFASRWLSPRLMNFMTEHSDIRLRMQPMVDLQELSDGSVDLVIRWGNGQWNDGIVTCLFLCPAFATGPCGINEKIAREGFHSQTMLRDWKHSAAWREWHGME